MKKLYYFAYGSNMWTPQMKKRTQKYKFIKTHILYGFSLVFNCGYSHKSTANIVENNNGFVEGVLYELDDEEIFYMDRFEGVPEVYVKRYFEIDKDTIAFAYVSVNKHYRTKAKPTVEYINRIIDGCLEHNFVSTYNSLVDMKINVLGVENSRHKIIK